MALKLWGARNKQLHSITLAEERQIQRDREKTVVLAKYTEGFRNVQTRFPVLYRESGVKTCDKFTLQLLKLIEKYEIYRGTIHRENTVARRELLKDIKAAYKNKAAAGIYDTILLFQEPRQSLI